MLDHGPFIDVWVQHAESCRGRGYPSLAREQTMEYFFENMFGRGIVSGDLNMSKVGVKSALHTWSSRTGHTQEDSDQRFKTWQIHTLLDSKHGDMALSHGLTATQIAETRVGCNTDDATSNAHELVVLQLNLEDLPPQKRPSLEPSSDARESSAAHPAPAARGLSENSRARKFLAALDEAAHGRDDNPAQAALLRELISSLWWGKLMLVPTNDVWHLDLDKHHEFAIAKLDQLIELVVTIRKAWIDSPESAAARNVAGRCLGPLEEDMTAHESRTAAGYLLLSMSKEKRAEYDFCFQASGSKQFLFARVRQPSVLKGEGLDKLLEEWAEIKTSTEYKKAVEQSKKRTQEQTKQKTELQNLRMPPPSTPTCSNQLWLRVPPPS